MHRIPEREVVVLDREDVREVGAEVQTELQPDRIHREVLEDDDVLHPFTDEALPDDRHLVLTESAGQRIPEEERRGEVLDLPRRQRQGRRAVDRQLQPREEARVLGEEPARLVADVADVVADAEGRAFEDREHQSRTIREPEACASAMTTISSTFTFGGRVTAKRMQSATSSARIGPPSATFA